jgi:hypothetical protein
MERAESQTRTEFRASEPRAASRDGRSMVELLKELRDETVTLMRQEVALAKVELSEKAVRYGRNIAYLAIGGLILYAGLLFLLAAAM